MMDTIILQEPGRFEMTRREDPPREPPPGHALVKVHTVGICGTDWHAYRGKQPFFTYPRILGHELGVEVVEVNDATSALKPDDRCAVEPYLNCNQCIACRSGKGNACANLQVLGVHRDGGMQQFLIVPCNKLHRSAKLTLDQKVDELKTAGEAAFQQAKADVEARIAEFEKSVKTIESTIEGA